MTGRTSPTSDESQQSELQTGAASASTPWWVQMPLGLLLLALGCVLLYSLTALWPATQAAVSEGMPPSGPAGPVDWFGGTYTPSSETDMLLLVILTGALGSYLHAIVSFADHAGNMTLREHWVWWYLARVLVGASLAVLVYLVIRGLLFESNELSGVGNAAGIAAMSGLAGLCARQATDWLRALVDVALRGAGHFVHRLVTNLRDRL